MNEKQIKAAYQVIELANTLKNMAKQDIRALFKDKTIHRSISIINNKIGADSKECPEDSRQSQIEYGDSENEQNQNSGLKMGVNLIGDVSNLESVIMEILMDKTIFHRNEEIIRYLRGFQEYPAPKDYKKARREIIKGYLDRIKKETTSEAYLTHLQKMILNLPNGESNSKHREWIKTLSNPDKK